MPRPTLSNGQIWGEDLANSAGYPILDGVDAYGHGPKLPNEWLSDEPDQIKAQFYGWYQRIRVQIETGLTVSHTGASVLLESGDLVTLSAGSLVLPSNSEVYIYVTDSGSISYAASLPAVCIPIAKAQTGATEVVNLSDLRAQLIEQVRQIRQAESSGFRIGDTKETARSTPEAGWFLCDNALYQRADYPIAYDEIGRMFSLPGDPIDTFRTPPPLPSVAVGPGRSLGQIVGADEFKMTTGHLVPHAHGTGELPHSHGSTSNHAHTTSENAHAHGLLGTSGTNGGVDSLLTQNSAVAGKVSGRFGYVEKTPAATPLMTAQKTNLSVNVASANVSIQPTKTGLQVLSTGEGLPIPLLNKSVVLNRFIRLA